MGARRYGISLRVLNVEMKTRREIPYLQATMYYFVYYINTITFYYHHHHHYYYYYYYYYYIYYSKATEYATFGFSFSILVLFPFKESLNLIVCRRYGFFSVLADIIRESSGKQLELRIINSSN